MYLRRKRCFLLVFGILLCTVIPASAGWLQVERDGSQMLLSDGKIKDVPEGADESWLAMDLRAQKILIANAEEGTCTEAPLAEYCELMETIYGAMLEGMGDFLGGEESEADSEVTVKKVGSGGKIAGMETDKYQVFADGELQEEVWLTQDTSLMKDLGRPEALRRFLSCMEGMGGSVESDPAYLEMSSSGWVLKEISYDMGEPEVDTEVVRLEKKDVPASEFTLPKDCRKVSLEEALGALE